MIGREALVKLEQWIHALPEGSDLGDWLKQQVRQLPQQPVALAIGACLLLGLVDWRLGIAAGAGLGSWQSIARLSPSRWHRLQVLSGKWQRRLKRGWGTPVLVSGLALGGTYTMLSALSNPGSPWVVLALLLQGGVGLLTLALVLRQSALNSGADETPQFETLLMQLTHPDPLTRLITVRQLVRWLSQPRLNRIYVDGVQISVRSHLIDCFELMLAREPEPLVCNALQQGLMVLQPHAELPEGSPPLATPMMTSQQTATLESRRAVEYVEPY